MTAAVSEAVANLAEVVQVVIARLCSLKRDRCDLRQVLVIRLESALAFDVFMAAGEVALALVKVAKSREPEVDKAIDIANHIRMDEGSHVMGKVLGLVGCSDR